jgi:hypothetical protein
MSARPTLCVKLIVALAVSLSAAPNFGAAKN